MLNWFKKILDPIDLTKGNILRCLLVFGLPVFISLFLSQGYGFIESFLYGHSLNVNEILGISNANASLYFATNLVSGLSVGLSVISGNAIGEGNLEKTRKSFVTQLIITISFTFFASLVFLPTIKPLLHFTGVNAETSKEVYDEAIVYIIAIYAGMIFESLYYFLLNYLRSIGEKMFPLIYVVLMIVFATSFNLLFVKGFGLGVIGVATSKYLAEFLAFIIGCIFLFIKRKELRISKNDFSFNLRFIWEHIKLSIPLGINFAIIGFGLIFVQKAVNNYGGNAIAAYNYSTKYVDIMMAAFNSLGATVLAFTAQNYGAKEYKRIKKGLLYSIYIALCMSLIMIAVGIPTSINGNFLHLFLSEKMFEEMYSEIFIYYASTYTLCAFALSPILGILFVGRNFWEAIHKPLLPFLSGIGETVERIIGSYYYAKIFDYNNPLSKKGFLGFSFAQPGAWIISCLVFYIPMIYYFKSDRLFKEKVEN